MLSRIEMAWYAKITLEELEAGRYSDFEVKSTLNDLKEYAEHEIKARWNEELTARTVNILANDFEELGEIWTEKFGREVGDQYSIIAEFLYHVKDFQDIEAEAKNLEKFSEYKYYKKVAVNIREMYGDLDLAPDKEEIERIVWKMVYSWTREDDASETERVRLENAIKWLENNTDDDVFSFDVKDPILAFLKNLKKEKSVLTPEEFKALSRREQFLYLSKKNIEELTDANNRLEKAKKIQDDCDMAKMDLAQNLLFLLATYLDKPYLQSDTKEGSLNYYKKLVKKGYELLENEEFEEEIAKELSDFLRQWTYEKCGGNLEVDEEDKRASLDVDCFYEILDNGGTVIDIMKALNQFPEAWSNICEELTKDDLLCSTAAYIMRNYINIRPVKPEGTYEWEDQKYQPSDFETLRNEACEKNKEGH